MLFKQVAQLSQRDRAAGCVSFSRKWKTGTGRQYFTDIIGLDPGVERIVRWDGSVVRGLCLPRN